MCAIRISLIDFAGHRASCLALPLPCRCATSTLALTPLIYVATACFVLSSDSSLSRVTLACMSNWHVETSWIGVAAKNLNHIDSTSVVEEPCLTTNDGLAKVFTGL